MHRAAGETSVSCRRSPLALGHPEQPFDNVRLDGDQQHLQFAAGGRAQNLVVPHDFFQRERHVLLRLVLDDLRDLAGIHRAAA